MSSWELPRSIQIGDKCYSINTDYRDILEIFTYFNDPDLSADIKWRIAIALFYDGDIPPCHFVEAIKKMSSFISEGESDTGKTPPIKVLDWEQDSKLIIADVNKVAGKEIRDLPYLHWWTFLSFFRGIREGQLSTVVSIRQKIMKKKKLEKWEMEFYQENKKMVDLQKKYSKEEIEYRNDLLKRLGE